MPYIWIPRLVTYYDQVNRVLVFETIDSFIKSVDTAYDKSPVKPVIYRTKTVVMVEHESNLVGHLVYRPIIPSDAIAYL